ncbi:MAG: hypothetical protein JRH01_22680 [Deltaproteobacteria bacterium]|nr:hypothetical protein [Deltaproteobacteria bacterium]
MPPTEQSPSAGNRARRAFQAFRSAHPSLSSLLAGCSASLAIVLVADLAFRGLEAYGKATKTRRTEQSATIFERDENLGYKLVPGAQSSLVRYDGDQVVRRLEYSIDDRGRRLTPMADAQQRARFALFFGGSNTFGVGVDDDETLPHNVSRLSEDLKPYNYAAPGWGPQHMLARLQHDDLADEVEAEEGVLVYGFHDGHVKRAIGSMFVSLRYGASAPYYTIDENGRLVRRGTFTSGRPGASTLFRLLNKSAIVRYLSIDIPLRIRDEHLHLTCKIMEESRRAFSRQFPRGDFVVVLFPGTMYGEGLTPCLEAAGIDTLDYSSLFDRLDPTYHIEGDGHPTPAANRRLAEELVNDLRTRSRG